MQRIERTPPISDEEFERFMSLIYCTKEESHPRKPRQPENMGFWGLFFWFAFATFWLTIGWITWQAFQ